MPIRNPPPAYQYGLSLLGQQNQGPTAPNIAGALSAAANPIFAALLLKKGMQQQEARDAQYSTGLQDYQNAVANELLPTGINPTGPVQMGEDPSLRDYSGVVQKASPGEAMGNALLGVKNPDVIRDLQPMIMQQQMADLARADERGMANSGVLAQQRYGRAQQRGAQEYGTQERLGRQDFDAQQTAGSQTFTAGQNELNRGVTTSEGALNRDARVQAAQIGAGGGPYRGTALDAQAMNILLDPNVDPSSPIYKSAYNKVAEPTPKLDQQTGQMVFVQPDMSAYRPIGGAAPAQQQTQGGGGPTLSAPVQAMTPKLTDSQNLAAGYSDRMTEANAILNNVDNQGASFWGRAKESVPGGVGNYAQSEDYRSFKQARDNFINAQLRRESGAVISPSEYANADKQYFPVPGDDEKVREQKRRNRESALAGMARSAGPTYKPPESKKSLKWDELP